MHRVRIGLTGLACVFLLVMLATAVLRLAQRDAGGDARKRAASAHLGNSQEAGPTEPLAQLGVAPGNTPPPAPAPSPAAPRR